MLPVAGYTCCSLQTGAAADRPAACRDNLNQDRSLKSKSLSANAVPLHTRPSYPNKGAMFHPSSVDFPRKAPAKLCNFKPVQGQHQQPFLTGPIDPKVLGRAAACPQSSSHCSGPMVAPRKQAENLEIEHDSERPNVKTLSMQTVD